MYIVIIIESNTTKEIINNFLNRLFLKDLKFAKERFIKSLFFVLRGYGKILIFWKNVVFPHLLNTFFARIDYSGFLWANETFRSKNNGCVGKYRVNQ